MSTGPGPDGMTEEQYRAALEAEMKRISIDEVVLQSAVSILNLGLRRTGLMQGTEDEKDLAQAQTAIEVVRAMMPRLEAAVPEQAKALRDGLSQLQMAYVRAGGTAPAAPAAPAAPGASAPPEDPNQPEEPEGPGPAQRSGRLWIPGQ
jgi:hypothetical protein